MGANGNRQLHSCSAQTKIARLEKSISKLKANINSFLILTRWRLFSKCLAKHTLHFHSSIQSNQSKRLLVHVYFVCLCDFSPTRNIISYQIIVYKNEGDITHLCSIQFVLLLNKNKNMERY